MNFTKEDVRIALFQMHPSKAPDPDGMSAMFYQHLWETLGDDITKVVLGLLNCSDDIEQYNKTNIVLIPKNENPTKMQEFRPISLCNVSYKVVSKMMVNRMKKILNSCISENQSAFVQGRQITDNAMVAYKMIHELNGRKKGPRRMVWKKLRNSGVAPKVKLCAWKLCNSILPTCGNLQIRLHSMYKRCAQCGAETEDSLHAVKQCPIAQEALQLCGFPQSVHLQHFDDPVIWLEKASETLNNDTFDLLLTAIWLIWTEQNAIIFHGATNCAPRLVEKIKSFHLEYKTATEGEARTTTAHMRTKWKPPEGDYVKVNFDASFNPTTKDVGAGIVVRDVDGFVLACASTKLGKATSATLAEAMVARRAIKFAMQSGFRRIILEGDALNVIKALRSEEQDFSAMGQWIDACEHLAKSFVKIAYVFTKRDGNKVANELARLANSLWKNTLIKFTKL